jgi:predicted DCC family thiol-disulfide oxidoreductase YuxK|tara:strand:+ start:87 stop:479 length:393 start_codon:yes stop_codon:yes gene_type:complete
MDEKTEIIYNENCPVCRFEINHYKKYVTKNNLPITFIDLNKVNLDQWNLTQDHAAKKLYAFKAGDKFEGIEAFRVLWSEMPKYRVLAALVKIPILNLLSKSTYNLVLAPIIYRMHLKREAKRQTNTNVKN